MSEIEILPPLNPTVVDHLEVSAEAAHSPGPLLLPNVYPDFAIVEGAVGHAVTQAHQMLWQHSRGYDMGFGDLTESQSLNATQVCIDQDLGAIHEFLESIPTKTLNPRHRQVSRILSAYLSRTDYAQDNPIPYIKTLLATLHGLDGVMRGFDRKGRRTSHKPHFLQPNHTTPKRYADAVLEAIQRRSLEEPHDA